MKFSDQLDRNSSLIEKLAIRFDDVDVVSQFPKHVNVSFNELGAQFHLEFVKKSNNSNSTTSLASHDIYVIDKATGNPVKYRMDKDEV
jgi:hypothetical protein